VDLLKVLTVTNAKSMPIRWQAVFYRTEQIFHATAACFAWGLMLDASRGTARQGVSLCNLQSILQQTHVFTGLDCIPRGMGRYFSILVRTLHLYTRKLPPDTGVTHEM
jgi:hypothetical protein